MIMVKRTTKQIARGTLAGAAALALGTEGYAAIQYSGSKNIDLSSAPDFSVDLDGDAVNDFTILGSSSTYWIDGLSGARVNTFHYSGYSFPTRFSSGQTISSALGTYGYLVYNFYSGADLAGLGESFIGVKFSNTTGEHLAWMRFDFPNNNTTSGGTLVDWAYNDAVGASINAGDGISAVPEPAETGAAMALGAVAVAALRRYRKRLAAKKGAAQA